MTPHRQKADRGSWSPSFLSRLPWPFCFTGYESEEEPRTPLNNSAHRVKFDPVGKNSPEDSRHVLMPRGTEGA